MTDYPETPENDDFRDHEFDCFLEKIKDTGKEAGVEGYCSAEWEIERRTFLLVTKKH